MLRVRIHDLHLHRNETTFRPYLQAAPIFREVGIEFVSDALSYDFAWIGQASYLDKTKSLLEAVTRGLEYLHGVTGDYWLFDGQDSASLIGSYNVFCQSQAQYLLKNTLYRDRTQYFQPWARGRLYWGQPDPETYAFMIHPDDWPLFGDRIVLSGANWLSTVPRFHVEHRLDTPRPVDVWAMFGYPAAPNTEYEVPVNYLYDGHRRPALAHLGGLEEQGLRVARLERGERVSLEAYYLAMQQAKVVVAPFGYGEIAPRDIEAAAVGAVLIKPDMGHLETTPNIYENGRTYIACRHDFSDLPEKVDGILSDYANVQSELVHTMRRRFADAYAPENLVRHIYSLFLKIPGIGHS
jgi:hypothetical protein